MGQFINILKNVSVTRVKVVNITHIHFTTKENELFNLHIIFLAQFLHLVFPGIALKTAFEIFYSRVGQHTSVGNYWNDPHHQALYYNYSQFLPYVNNELTSTRSKDFKLGLTKLNKMVLIGGPNDDVITPWQSRYFL